MAAPDLVDILAPLEQEGTKAVVRAWFKTAGEAVVKGEPLLELETDKVAMEIAAPAAGVLVERLLDEGEEATPGAVLGRLGPQGAATPPSARPAQTPPPPPARPSTAPDLRLSPSVRRLLAEAGLTAAGLTGSGRGGRLTREDVLAEIARRKAALTAGAGEVTRVPHDSVRRRIAEHMARSLAVSPHVTAIFEADLSRIIAHRREQSARSEAKGVALTYTAYFVAASARAMAAAPAVNGRWHDDHLELFSDINIGVGVALGDKGLIVPVIRRVQDLDLIEIAERLQDLTQRARVGKLAPADVQGGTFSISNHGVSGSLLAAPIIINQPQAAILGVGKLEKRVVVRQVEGADAILIRPMAYVSLSIDHRVLDGAQTNAWLTRFVEVLESWPAD